jgi:hypothetical protein
MPKKKSKRDHKTSSGLKQKRRAKRTIKRLVMKMARWDRYKEEIEKGRRPGPASRWNTDRIQKHIELLERL